MHFERKGALESWGSVDFVVGYLPTQIRYYLSTHPPALRVWLSSKNLNSCPIPAGLRSTRNIYLQLVVSGTFDFKIPSTMCYYSTAIPVPFSTLFQVNTNLVRIRSKMPLCVILPLVSLTTSSILLFSILAISDVSRFNTVSAYHVVGFLENHKSQLVINFLRWGKSKITGAMSIFCSLPIGGGLWLP